MAGAKIPLVILAGSDRRPTTLPDEGRDKHPLSGFKGVDIRIDGRPLVETVVDRLERSGRFAPIYLVGPEWAYRNVRTSAKVIDADGTFGQNIETAVRAVTEAHPGLPVGFTVCDILPEVDTLRDLMGEYDRQGRSVLWFPIIHSPADRRDLGASAWKPAYRIVPEPGEPAVEVLPGHLVVTDLNALRLPFLYKLFEAAYRTRNRSISYRRTVMLRAVMGHLLRLDLRRVLRFRLPSVTWSVVRTGSSAARSLMAGTITRGVLEQAVATLLVKRDAMRAAPGCGVQLPIVDALSLALDMDTREEAEQMGADVAPRSA